VLCFYSLKDKILQVLTCGGMVDIQVGGAIVDIGNQLRWPEEIIAIYLEASDDEYWFNSDCQSIYAGCRAYAHMNDGIRAEKTVNKINKLLDALSHGLHLEIYQGLATHIADRRKHCQSWSIADTLLARNYPLLLVRRINDEPQVCVLRLDGASKVECLSFTRDLSGDKVWVNKVDHLPDGFLPQTSGNGPSGAFAEQDWSEYVPLNAELLQEFRDTMDRTVHQEPVYSSVSTAFGLKMSDRLMSVMFDEGGYASL